MKKLLLASLIFIAVGFSSTPINTNSGFSATTFYVVPTSTSNYKQATQQWGARGISANALRISGTTTLNALSISNINASGTITANKVVSNGGTTTNIVASGFSRTDTNNQARSGSIRLGTLTDHGYLDYNGNSGAMVIENTYGGSGIFLRTAGTDKLTVLGGGNVGIGTTAPSTKLEVAGTVSASALQVNGITTFHGSPTNGDPLLILSDSYSGANNGPLIALKSEGTQIGTIGSAGDGWLFGSISSRDLVLDSAKGVSLWARNTGSIKMFTGGAAFASGTQVMTISQNGNVGIGTTAPSAKLEVAGTVSANEFTSLSQPRIIVNKSDSSQSINNASETVLTWSATEGSSGCTLQSNSSLVASSVGDYLIVARVSFASNATGYRKVFIRKGGVNIAVGASAAANGDSTEVTVSGIFRLAVNDAISVSVYQTSGGALNVNGTAVLNQFSIVKLH